MFLFYIHFANIIDFSQSRDTTVSTAPSHPLYIPSVAAISRRGPEGSVGFLGFCGVCLRISGMFAIATSPTLGDNVPDQKLSLI